MQGYQIVSRPRWAADGGNGSVVPMTDLEMDTDPRSDECKFYDAYEPSLGLSTDGKLRLITWILIDLRAESMSKSKD